MHTFTKVFSLLTIAAGAGFAQYVAVDLNTVPNAVEAANAMAAGMQAGSASIPSTQSASAFHAFTWNGTPDTAADIHPLGWYSSQAWAAAPGQVAGFGSPVPSADVTAGAHALLWSNG